MKSGQRCEVVLLRHAHSTANEKGILAGRDNSVGLSAKGSEQAEAVAQFLTHEKFDKIYVSDLTRCKETIAPLLSSLRKNSGQSVTAQRSKEVMEMDYGSWSGKKLAVLSKRPLWSQIQQRPSMVRFPEGESFTEMALRANQGIAAMAQGKKKILVVSHGDVVKAILANHLGLPLDNFQRISIDPASISRIVLPYSQVVEMNNTSHLKKSSGASMGARPVHTLGGGAGVQ
jgi:probable phosphomutase (TIGR03848 family)